MNQNPPQGQKKILLLAKSGGFISQFELQNVRMLRDMGYEIFYAADFEHPVYDLREKDLEELGVRRIQIDISGSPLAIFRHLGELKKLQELVKRERIRCVHCHTPVGGFMGRMLGRSFGKKLKVIYTVHGFHFYSGAPLRNWIFYPAEAWMARYTDALITINGEDFHRAKQFRLRPGGKVYQIPGVGIDESRLIPSAEGGQKWRREHGIPEAAFHLVSMGELNKNKNHRVILRALKSLGISEIYFTVFGEGKQRQALEQEIAELELSGRVQLPGYEKNIADALASADAFVFPSRREGLGMAALEAMAVGLPVIAADNRGSREYVVPEVNGYLCRWNDAQAFAEAVRRLYLDPGLRQRMGMEGRRAAARFSREKTMEKMAEIYRKRGV